MTRYLNDTFRWPVSLFGEDRSSFRCGLTIRYLSPPLKGHFGIWLSSLTSEMPNCPIFAFLVAKGFVFAASLLTLSSSLSSQILSDLVVWLLRATVLSSYVDEIKVIKWRDA